MKTNTTELLSKILKGMSDENIEVTDIKIYEEAVDINNKVKICIANDRYIVHKVNEGGGYTYYFDYSMIKGVLKLLKHTINKGEYVTDGYASGMLIKIDEDKYNIVDVKNHETIYRHSKTLEELERHGWQKGDLAHDLNSYK